MRYALYCNRQLFHVVSHIYCGGMGSILMLETPEKQLFAEEGIFHSQHAKKIRNQWMPDSVFCAAQKGIMAVGCLQEPS